MLVSSEAVPDSPITHTSISNGSFNCIVIFVYSFSYGTRRTGQTNWLFWFEHALQVQSQKFDGTIITRWNEFLYSCMTSNLSIDFLLWQQHDDHAMSPKGYASQRQSSGRTGSMLSSGLISSRIAQGIFAIRGSWWRRLCAIGWTPMTSPGVRSLNIIKTPRAAWLAMSRLFTQARTCCALARAHTSLCAATSS